MDAAEMSPRLPGTSASGEAQWQAIATGVLVPVFVALIIPLVTSIGSEEGGHLPWPIVQWAVTSPVGAFVLVAVGTLIMAPPLVLLQSRAWQGHSLAWATDVTGMPLAEWSRRSRAQARRPRMERWLGRDRREQRISLALLTLGFLLAAGLLGAFIAAITDLAIRN